MNISASHGILPSFRNSFKLSRAHSRSESLNSYYKNRDKQFEKIILGERCKDSVIGW